MTKRLFDIDSHMFEFIAKVLGCEKIENGYTVELDETAFFPEGGGQYGDTGFIGDIPVSDTQIKDGTILHYVNQYIEPGTVVHCRLDSEKRFQRMQNHSGEHIVSGFAHTMFGIENVGFHMGDDDMTVDFNIPLTREQLREVELRANRLIAANVPIHAWYPTDEELAGMDYRSKLELTENIRIVEIEGCDRCACCAPHVNRTGEIGIIKILDFMHWKGGIRLHLICGINALRDYNIKYDNILKISAVLSVKQHETAAGVDRFMAELDAQRRKVTELRREIAKLKADAMPVTDKCLTVFQDDADPDAMRELANGGMEKCPVIGVFAGQDGAYRYIIASKTVDLRAKAKEINGALHGKGGGVNTMIQGSCIASRSEIESYFEALI